MTAATITPTGNRPTTLNALAVGDTVGVCRPHRYRAHTYKLATVVRVTKTQATLDDGDTFSMKSLDRVGGYRGEAVPYLVNADTAEKRIADAAAQAEVNAKMEAARKAVESVLGGIQNGLRNYGKLTAAQKAELMAAVAALPVEDTITPTECGL